MNLEHRFTIMYKNLEKGRSLGSNENYKIVFSLTETIYDIGDIE
jgi:hypothetical protein